MYCNQCGEKMETEDVFCKSCGAVAGEKKKKKNLKWLSYIWTVIVNLITVGVVFAIYGSLYDSFEIIVVSLLIVIYLSFQSFSMIYSKITAETAFALDGEFKRIRKLLKNEPTEYENEEILDAKKKVEKSTIKIYINGAFILINYIIALIHLLGAL